MADIQDGWGDRTDLDIDQYIRDNERLLRLKTAERLRGNSNATDVWDDVLQEGRIVQAQVLARRPDAPREYVSAAMSMRIGEVISRGTWTGMPTSQGKPRDPLRRGDRSSVDDETLQLDLVVDQADWVDHALLGYHQGQIMQALDELTFTQKVHVLLRFWGGWSNAEIAAHQGCSKQTVERQFREVIRPHLAESLGLLAGM